MAFSFCCLGNLRKQSVKVKYSKNLKRNWWKKSNGTKNRIEKKGKIKSRKTFLSIHSLNLSSNIDFEFDICDIGGEAYSIGIEFLIYRVLLLLKMKMTKRREERSGEEKNSIFYHYIIIIITIFIS